MQKSFRCDLHTYSCFSTSSSWLMRKAGLRPTYQKPVEVYRKLDGAGFDFITLTDLNTIEGCLEIEHLPKAFISAEVSASFPEDGCEVHLLIWNITEAQFKTIQALRTDIYQLVYYLHYEKIIHALAHPLRFAEPHLSIDHFEKLILLFRNFETQTGNSFPQENQALESVLTHLTPQFIQELASRHALEPTHSQAWKKNFICASAMTGKNAFYGYLSTESADSISSFLKKLELGQYQNSLTSSSGPHLFAEGLYSTLLHLEHHKSFQKIYARRVKLMRLFIERLLAGANPTAFSPQERAGWLMEALRNAAWSHLLSPPKASFAFELASYFLDRKVAKEFDQLCLHETSDARRSFLIASKLFNDLVCRFSVRTAKELEHSKYEKILPKLPLLAPAAVLSFSYIASLWLQKPKRELLQKLTTGWKISPALPSSIRRAWFTDTLEDVNGVARTIRTMAESAQRAKADLTLITCSSSLSLTQCNVHNFKPLGEFNLPEYPSQKVALPPLLEMIDFIERQKFSECIISTPGPVGLAGLLAAKLLGLRVSVIDHTDFPHYVRQLTGDPHLELMSWSFLDWFYRQADHIFVNSEFYRKRLVARGFEAQTLSILPRGMDTTLFNPSRAQENFWKKRGARGPVLLYVGRISKEKGLDFLARVFQALQLKHPSVTLALVGDGPFAQELQNALPQAIFTGVLHAQELAAGYASADFFVFPSTTDTFGNVVLEALASGLPAFVSNQGGPQELITSPHDGRVLPARNLDAWVEALEAALSNHSTRDIRLQRVEALQKKWSWESAFEKFWHVGSEPLSNS